MRKTLLALVTLSIASLWLAPGDTQAAASGPGILEEDRGTSGGSSASSSGSSYPSTGHWEGFSLSDACDESNSIESRVCAEWFDDQYPNYVTLCCIDQHDLWSTDFSDCQEVVAAGPRGPML